MAIGVDVNRSGWLLAALALALVAVKANAAAPIVPPPPTINAGSYLLVDATTDKILAENNANEPMAPASLTKIMTVYIAAMELEAGRVTLEDSVPVSVKAWKTPGSRMFVREGTSVPFKALLNGIIVQSGNDASVALAEHIAGSEDAFADMMNQQAVKLGMTNSFFRNSTGLPASDHVTSAWDLVLLTKALVNNYPETYALYSQRSFKYNDIEQPNRNRLLWRDKTVDGVKTGMTTDAGYCLVASAVRDGTRLISVVMKTASDNARMQESQKLLSYGFRYFETRPVYEAGVPMKQAELFYGEEDAAELGLLEAAVLTYPRGHFDAIEAKMKLPAILEAPLAKGEEVGELSLELEGEEIFSAPLVALHDYEEGGWFSAASDFVTLFFRQLFAGE